jgi:hypothetical protein
VCFIDDVVAIVACKVNERIVVDGKTRHIEAKDSSVGVRRDPRRLSVLHAESLPGTPMAGIVAPGDPGVGGSDGQQAREERTIALQRET